MGIKGLKTLIEKNEDFFLTRYELQQTELVIDGPNILHYLFQKSKDSDFLHGGDYNNFAYDIREFFRVLKRCGVRPIVVMDGGHFVDDRKLITRKRRAEERFQRLYSHCQRMSTGDFSERRMSHFVYKNLPILGYNLFLNVVRDMEIPVITCQFEADKEIANIANKQNCPVLSQDSDFYAVRIDRGFLPIDHLKIKNKGNVPVTSFIPSKLYHVDKFASFFPGLGMAVFPLLAVLFGNDYTNKEDFQPFLNSISDSLTGQRVHCDLRTANCEQKKIIHWLVHIQSPSLANDQMAGAVQQESLRAFQIVVDAYSLNKQSPPCLVRVPGWFLEDHRECLIASIFMTIVTSQRIFLSCQPEHFESPSSYECSEPLRQLLYGILLKDCGKTTVEEYDRHAIPSSEHSGDNIACKTVTVCREVGYLPVPGLDEIGTMRVEDRQKVLQCALQMENAFDDFDPEMRILLGMTSFWYKHSTPNVSSNHLSSLIVCWIMLKIEYKHQNPHLPPKESIIDKTVYESPHGILKRILKNLNPFCNPSPCEIRFDIVHAFAQFQTCLISAHDLNSILRFPFPSFDMQNLFFGKFLHYFCITLEEEPHIDVSELLEADSALSNLYERIIQNF